jgi:hypothetical protein
LLFTGAGVVLWSREHPRRDTNAVRGDVPLLLLQWAVGLLPADRLDWGQAMLGELDQVDGRSERWRFSLGCVTGVVLLPSSGSVAPMTLVALVLGSTLVLGIGFVHFELVADPWNWFMLAILATLMMCCLVVVRVQLRRPGVARLGLVGGFFVAATWLAFSGFTWAGVINPYSMGAWTAPELLIAVPLVVGAGSAWRSGSACVGRRAARLAGAGAGLVMFFVGTIAVVAIDGGPRDPGAGVAGGVSEAFSNVAMLFLIFLPLATAAIGWVAATATARLRSVELTQRILDSRSAPKTNARVAKGRQSKDFGRLVLRAAVVAAAVIAVALIFQVR